MDDDQYLFELNKCIQKILGSKAPKKLIVAGPGTGKSSFFRKVIQHGGGFKRDYLALTFINSLEDELQKDIGEMAHVHTFHGYCYFLLKRDENLRGKLGGDFEYYPGLVKLVKSDWQIQNGSEPPQFLKSIRSALLENEVKYFLSRGDYYNATGYDDSVFRVLVAFDSGELVKSRYKLIIVDEYQDFNLLETKVLSYLSDFYPILIVGDDDQALYCILRNSDPDFIRTLYKDENFVKFELPFCLRCPEAVISIFRNIVSKAVNNGLLAKRINKRFDYFAPIKRGDSEKYPKVNIVKSTIQRSPINGNYWGRYILEEIKKIPAGEINDSQGKKFPTVLIIGPNYYSKTVTPVLDDAGYEYQIKNDKQELEISLDDGLKLLKKDEKSNLGWRIVLETVKPDFYSDAISKCLLQNAPLATLMSEEFTKEILEKAKSIEIEERPPEIVETDLTKPTIKFTTFEGAKGLSAQHVFILGFQNGNLPRNPNNILDIEVCKFLVALTRTRKQCHILYTTNFAGHWIGPSEFINWLKQDNLNPIEIDKNYWKNKQA